MYQLSAATRRANLLVLAGLIIFALALAAVCFFWMRGVVRANGGVVDPHRVGVAAPSATSHFSFV